MRGSTRTKTTLAACAAILAMAFTVAPAASADVVDESSCSGWIVPSNDPTTQGAKVCLNKTGNSLDVAMALDFHGSTKNYTLCGYTIQITSPTTVVAAKTAPCLTQAQTPTGLFDVIPATTMASGTYTARLYLGTVASGVTYTGWLAQTGTIYIP